ncbi:hypothetical protein Bbelb_232900 [Branchiostoma belcheri]|nr:hypothetical protein Bbelb_232900 [Branchiostoma belcheri]
MQTSKEKAFRGVKHQDQNTTYCGPVAEPCAEVPLPINSGHDDNQGRSPGKKSLKSPLYVDTTDDEDFKLMPQRCAYRDTEDKQESARQAEQNPIDDTGQEQTTTLSRLYGCKPDHKEATKLKTKDRGGEDPARKGSTDENESGQHSDSKDVQARSDSGYEIGQPTIPPVQESTDEVVDTGPSTPEQDKDDHEEAGKCGFAKSCNSAFQVSCLLRVFIVTIAVAALLGIAVCFAMYFTVISGNEAGIHPNITAYTTSSATKLFLTTNISTPSEVTTVLSDVPTVLSDVPTVLSDVPTVLSDVPTVLSDVPTVLSKETTAPSDVTTVQQAYQTITRQRVTKTGTETVREDHTLRLSCPAGQSLVIDEASFRYNNRRAEKSLLIVWSACQGLQRCNVRASPRVFGDPAHGYSKTLQAKYRCFTACSKPFGMISHVIPDDRITASSYWESDPHYEPYRARVRLIGGAGSGTWGTGNNIVGEWLQVDLGGMNLITGTISQGSGEDYWVRSYKLRFSADRTTWTTYADSDGFDKVFKGNTDRDTHVTNLLDYPIYARYVRFVVQSWQDHIGMRVEILGCSKNVGDCEPNPCANGGTCLDHEGGFDCACRPPFYGKNCSIFCDTLRKIWPRSGYHWTEKPLTGSRFMFEVEATSDVFVALSSKKQNLDDMYEILIGGMGNTKSGIRRSKSGITLTTAETFNFVCRTEYRMFWITWSSDGTIAVGRGNETQPFLQYKDPNPLPIIFAGFSTNTKFRCHLSRWNLCHIATPEDILNYGEDCQVDPNMRKNCGYSGITPDQCRQKGCCFNDSVDYVKWCYHKK